MKASLLTFGIIALYLSQASAQTAAPPISVVVHVDAGKRKPPTISSPDLVIFDNDAKIGAAASVESAVKRDAAFAIVVDASGSMLDKVGFIKKALVETFDAVTVSPSSKGLLFTFADAVNGGDKWLNRADVQEAMRGFTVKQGGRSALYAGLTEVARKLGEQSTSRRLVFVVTDGDDTSTGVTSQDAITACLKAGVTVIPIGLLSYHREKLGRASLANLADATGGRAVILDGPADVKALVTDVLNSEYVVTFAPTISAGFHSLTMELAAAPNGVSLKTPKGFYSR